MYHRGEFVTGQHRLRNTHTHGMVNLFSDCWHNFSVGLFIEAGCPPASILTGVMLVEFFHIG
jgi:zinc transporter ZupT